MATGILNNGDYSIEDDSNGNLIVADANDNTVLTYNDSAGQWELDNLTVSNSPTNSNDAAIKSYVDSVAQGLNWQEPVIDEQNDPPASPNTGDRYLIDDSPTGDWSGHPNEIAEWNGSSWDFFVAEEGWAVFVEDVDLLKVFQSGDWVSFGSAIDHGNLAGLGDDDHSQYVVQDGSRTADEISNKNYVEPQVTASEGASYTVDVAQANYHKVTLTGDVTFDFSNTDASDTNSVLLHLVQDGTGGRTPSFTPTVVWDGGSAPSWSTSASAEDVVSLAYDQDASQWLGFVGGIGMA